MVIWVSSEIVQVQVGDSSEVVGDRVGGHPLIELPADLVELLVAECGHRRNPSVSPL